MGAFGSSCLPVFLTVLTHRHRFSNRLLGCLFRWLRLCLCRCGGCFGWRLAYVTFLCRSSNNGFRYVTFLLYFMGFGCCFLCGLCRHMAHNLAGELGFILTMNIAVHQILNKISICIRNIIHPPVLMDSTHTSHHHCRFLTAVLVADSQLHVGCIVGWSTCHNTTCSCLRLFRVLRWHRSFINSMTLTVVCHCFLVSDALQL